ncbi:MAG: MltA domain-containing protein [Alphaproteobacteria bacterium]|nr:MltA domain-containing protein [Alphaproteobacteria bacterium]
MRKIAGKLSAITAIAVLLAGCAAPFGTQSPRLSLSPSTFDQIRGWPQNTAASAVPAFLKSCARLTGRPDAAPLDPAARSADFGRVGDWRPLCRDAAALPRGDDVAARHFFEANFLPVLAGHGGDSDGVFTGYYEVELKGSRQRQGPYQTPVYRRPPELAALQPYFDRAAIEDGALSGRGLEVLWLADPADLLTLQTQGSGRVRLTDGTTTRLVYDGNNGRPTVAVDQLILAHGELPAARFTQNAVRAWMLSYPARAQAIRREDPAYAFFRERQGDGPVGAAGVVLTPERSLAVDRHYVPLGMPLWLEATDRYTGTQLRRLMVAQDTGDGVQGPVRGDVFWGSGPGAQTRGSDLYAGGRYWLLLPRTVAERLSATRLFVTR